MGRGRNNGSKQNQNYEFRYALECIEDGTFGVCDECDGKIGIPRLMARPVATLCIRCKTRMEAGEKLYG